MDNPNEPARHLHHREMNAALDEVVADIPNASVCDMRVLGTSQADLMSDIRHYRRHVYLRIAEEIRTIADSDLTFQPHTIGKRTFDWAWRFAGRRKVQARRTWRRLNDRPVGPA